VTGSEPIRTERERVLRERLIAAPGREPVVPIVAVLGGLFLGGVASGWIDLYVDPGHGLGYGLGIVGVIAMCLLLIYPARKRLAIFAWLPPLRQMFRFHMVLGVLTPTLILLHSDFALGSLNSRVALGSLLLVSGSGFFGRFIYSRIHRGLFGSRRELAETRREAAEEGGVVHAAIRDAPELEARLQRFEAMALETRPRFWDRLTRFLAIGWRGGVMRREARRALGAGEGRAAYRGFERYVRSLSRVARFLDYERLFSLWHAIHVPICFLLFASTAVHVLAVHLY